MNVAKNLEMTAARLPSTPAILFEKQKFDYAAVEACASQFGNLLRDLGIQAGDRVAIFLPNIPDFVFAYFGILKLGAIVVSVNVRLKLHEVEVILEDSRPQVIISTKELLDELPRDRVPTVLAFGVDLPTGVRSLEELKMEASNVLGAVDVTPNSPCSILYTSGTTGTPKGAVLSHSNVISNVQAANHHCGNQQGQRMLLFLPLFHCFGQNAIMNCAVAVGATLVLHRQFVLEDILESVQRHHVTHFYAVPTIYVRLLNVTFASKELASITYYFSAAAKMPLEVASHWQQQFGLPIFEGYGLTETSPFSTYNHASKYKAGTVGTPIQDVEVAVMDELGQVLPTGEIGEVVVRGPNVMLGYWNRPLETQQVISNGWFHTGDLGTVDEEGYLSIRDRLKDMINVSGFKVYPVEVENILYQHPGIAEAAVYGLPDSEWGEAVQANIILKPEMDVSVDDLMTFCKERIASYKVPRTINFVTNIPKNATGKVLKREIVAQALQTKAGDITL